MISAPKMARQLVENNRGDISAAVRLIQELLDGCPRRRRFWDDVYQTLVRWEAKQRKAIEEEA